MKKLFAIMLSAAILLLGFGYLSTMEEGPSETIKSAGVITLSVNPKINIHYDDEGKVIDLSAGNEDGEKVIANMQDYVGKDTKEVISNLVKEIHAEGYFVKDVDGYTKDIVIQIKDGSLVPSDNYLVELEEEVRETVAEMNLTSNTTTIVEEDYVDVEEIPSDYGKVISKEKAQEIALKRIDLTIEQTDLIKVEVDKDKNIYKYEVEIIVGDMKYEVDVDVTSGSVLDVDVEHIDPNDIDDESFETSEHIGKEKAKDIALAKAGLSEEEVSELKSEFELDKSIAIYEVSFIKDGMEYEYDIDALTGEIIDEDIEVVEVDEDEIE